MTFLVISDNERYCKLLCLQIERQFNENSAEQPADKKLKPPAVKQILTSKTDFATLEVLHTVFNTSKFDSQTILLFDAEIVCTEEKLRNALYGFELAFLCKTSLRTGFRGRVYLVGFNARKVISDSKRGKALAEEYDFHYLRLPLSFEDIKSVIPDETYLLQGDKQYEERHLTFIQNFGQTYLIGIIDDDARIRIPSLNFHLSKIWEKGPRQQRALFVEFPFNRDQPFELNFERFKSWSCYIEVLDFMLIDVRFETRMYGIREWGLEILQRLHSLGTSVPIAMLSSTSERDSIVQSTVGYKDIVNDYIIVETATPGHHGAEIRKPDEIAKKIFKALSIRGAVRTRFGVLITHGTDTMAWTLSLLRYAIKGQKANIILTGSQVSLQSEFSPSDAPSNIISSLYFLNQLIPPITGVVFNQGRSLYQSNVAKVRIWDMNAYEGESIASFDWEEIKADQTRLLRFDNTLDELLVFTTGGTIAMKKTNEGQGSPSHEALSRFFESEASKYRNPLLKSKSFYRKKNLIDVCKIDSSEVCPPIYKKLLSDLEEKNNSLTMQYGEGFAEAIEREFKWRVYPIFCTPFFTSGDYFHFKKFSDQYPSDPVVFIILGFGAGNVSPKSKEDWEKQGIDPKDADTFSPIEFVTKVVQKDVVILSSQVPIETPDIDYEVAEKFIEAGAIPGGNMSLSEMFMKCAYLLGHYNGEGLDFLKSTILAGVRFRSEQSKKRYLLKLNELRHKGKQYHVVPPTNYFINQPYQDAKKEFEKVYGHADRLDKT